MSPTHAPMKFRVHQWKLIILLVSAACPSQAAENAIYRVGDELVVKIDRLDRLRLASPRLKAAVVIGTSVGDHTWSLDLSQAINHGPLIFDVHEVAKLTRASVTITDESGQAVFKRQVRPVPVLTVASDVPLGSGQFAAIEPGTRADSHALPKISLPDVSKLRMMRLSLPPTALTVESITYPVVAEVDLPSIASNNAVIVSRQSFAPQEASKCSLYFSYRKPLFDASTLKLTRYVKMLVEVPLDRDWLTKSGDETIALPLDGFAIHATDEREREPQRWNSAVGYNMLGESSTGLYQGGQTVDTDDLGRIYITNVSDGAGVVRFNPQAGKFEQPPVNLIAECRKFLPTGGEWKRSWDTDLQLVVCTRGRVYLVFDRNYRVTTSNGKFETCSGVISFPQDNWNDADAFRKGIRLHAGCWPGAKPSLYTTEVENGKTRRLGAPIATTQGIAFGSWRLDLDARGETVRLVEVNGLNEPVARGAAVPRVEPLLSQGLPKQRLINVGHAGRAFLQFGYGEFTMSRAALGLTLPGAPADRLADSSGRSRNNYEGAPSGNLTVRFDIASKIRKDPGRYIELAAGLSGVSQGPNYALIAIDDEPGQAIGVCEYSYFYSKLDFSRRAKERKVHKSYLPLSSGGQTTGLPLSVGLGPYNTTWIDHDNARWLYIPGYTGICRLKYSENGKPLAGFTSEIVHVKLSPKPLDGVPRDSVKDFLHLVPSLGGKWIDIGRGRPGRGGGAYSAGLELFDPRTLQSSGTLVAMNRCYGLYTPVSRVVHSPSSGARQEIFVASGNIRPEYVDDIADASRRPRNQDPKLFAYRCDSTGLHDLFGFALPRLEGDASANIALSPCGQFLVALQQGGIVLTYHIAAKRFVDGIVLRNQEGASVQPLSFGRPAATLWTGPNARIFFHAALNGDASKAVGFFEVVVSNEGRLSVRPHRAITWGTGRIKDFDDVVRCFLPDLESKDGSYDLVLGGDQENGGQPTVRVIDDFLEAE